MRKRSLALLLACALVGGVSLSAQAGHVRWSVAFASDGLALQASSCRGYGHGRHSARSYGYGSVCRPVYARPVVLVQPVGHYVCQSRRVWVPGSWAYVDTGYGRARKVWQPAGFRTVVTRVWVNDCDR